MTSRNVKQQRMKGRSGKTFTSLPHEITSSKNWAVLSPYAVKLLIDLAAQYRGWNNGNLCAAWSVMRTNGWRSESTLHNAIKELKVQGFIINTKQGMRMKGNPALFAITWQGIDDCGGKLDVLPCPVPSNAWRENKTPIRYVKRPIRNA